jgi:hypothetical protein
VYVRSFTLFTIFPPLLLFLYLFLQLFALKREDGSNRRVNE